MQNTVTAQPGKYAGTKKSLIGKVYTDIRTVSFLPGWTFKQGDVINAVGDPEIITADVYQKETTYLVLFSINDDTATNQFIITDVLEVKAVIKGWTVKTSFCRQQQIDNSWIVALAKETPTEYLAIIKKAWRFNPDKRRIELISTKGIDCLNQEFDID